MTTTQELLEALSAPGISIELFFKEHEDDFLRCVPSDAWALLIKKSMLLKAEIIKQSDFEPVYFYEIIGGKKNPSRDKLIRLLYGMHSSLDDCQLMLKVYGYSTLYPRVKRDSLFIHGLINRVSLPEIQDLLLQKGEKPLK